MGSAPSAGKAARARATGVIVVVLGRWSCYVQRSDLELSVVFQTELMFAVLAQIPCSFKKFPCLLRRRSAFVAEMINASLGLFDA